MRRLHGTCVQRGLMCIALCGLLLSVTDSVAFASTPKHRHALEAAACKLISITPLPPQGAQEAIALPQSTLSALKKTDNTSFQAIVRAFDKAALAMNNDAMIDALNNGVKLCHRLGLPTAP